MTMNDVNRNYSVFGTDGHKSFHVTVKAASAQAARDYAVSFYGFTQVWTVARMSI